VATQIRKGKELSPRTVTDQESEGTAETMGTGKAWLNLNSDKEMEVKERETDQLETPYSRTKSNSVISMRARGKTNRKFNQFMMSSLLEK